MARKRPRGVLAMGWACVECALTGRAEHAPMAETYKETEVRRMSFAAGGGLGWTLSAIDTPRERPAPWKIVVITGAPSWAEYWAPALADLPPDREMVVVDRPGYGASEPQAPVCDIALQAEALAPLLRPTRGQRILLVGQSYGAAIASVMAAENPGKVAGLVLMSGYFGEPGPTARWLVDAGARMLKVLPRDLRNAVREVSGQPAQLEKARRALARLRIPVHVIHGDQDDFAPIEIAERLVRDTRTRLPMRFERVEGANHFLNDGPTDALLAAIEACIPRRPEWRMTWPAWLRGATMAAEGQAARQMASA
ncbi:MAG: alpha/beta fold hydrolase [Phenylobacterium sp.]|uniref:alpha/beta fold hydrolase n=1 Tax=Phenylobacterium sp. TaxID=1871053 RepID=UPI00391A4201